MRNLSSVVFCLLLAIFDHSSLMLAQDMSNSSCGRVNNNGKISVKGELVSVRGAQIENTSGVLLCGGNTEIRQDEIKGYVEYRKDSSSTQRVPQIRHSVVMFSGRSPKLLDTTYNGKLFVSVDTITTKAEAQLVIQKNFPLIALGRVSHDGRVNDAGDDASVILNGAVAQNLDGLGSFKTLELDNPDGVFLINKAGLSIETNLYLHRGAMHNATDHNVVMQNTSRVTRSDESSIDDYPAHQKSYSVRYVGTNSIRSAREIPLEKPTLASLIVHNDGGLTMTSNITVNDSLIVGRDDRAIDIRTDDDTVKHTLTFTTSSKDPVYSSPRSEVIGTLTRSGLRSGSTAMIFNNRYTTLRFDKPENLASATSLSIESRPQTFPVQARGQQKVKRLLNVQAQNAAGAEITAGLRYTFNYAWIDDLTSTTVHESNNLDVSSVILQRWDERKWSNIKTSVTPAQSSLDRWMVSHADSVTHTGSFAIGMPTPIPPMLVARVQMEGPYRNGSMATDLQKRNLIPMTPPDVYPYNLDSNRSQNVVKSFAPNVVDWVVVELRRGISIRPDIIKSGLLLSDGSIINPDGIGFMTFPDTLPVRDYYVVVRHRNHLSVMTSQPWHLVDEDAQTFSSLDLSDGLKVFGGFGSLKAVCFGKGQPTLFAMPAGDVNGDGVIDDRDRSDYDSIYNLRDQEGYLAQDTDLSGIVTTRDLNKSWNNRSRRTAVPR